MEERAAEKGRRGDKIGGDEIKSQLYDPPQEA
jgi:hypothetical protein